MAHKPKANILSELRRFATVANRPVRAFNRATSISAGGKKKKVVAGQKVKYGSTAKKRKVKAASTKSGRTRTSNTTKGKKRGGVPQYRARRRSS